jgi:hypothetical protein
MPLPQFEIIKLKQLKKYRPYEKYDDYLKVKEPRFYAGLVNPQITEIADVAIEERMRDAIRFFASKGVGELTQIRDNFDENAEIINGIQKFVGDDDYAAMNQGVRDMLGNSELVFNAIKEYYESEMLRNVSVTDSYIYNLLSAFTKTTPSQEKFYVFRCFQQLPQYPDAVPLLDANGVMKPRIYLNQFTSTSILLRVCDFWCTPPPINNANPTNPFDPANGDNTIICIEIPIGTHGISIINYAGILYGQLTTIYSEFEYLLPPGGTLELTRDTYDYTSITRAQLHEITRLDPLNAPIPNLPVRFHIPIYKYHSFVPDNRSFKNLAKDVYIYKLPALRSILVRNMIYLKDQVSEFSSRILSSARRRSGYERLAEGRRPRKLRKRTRKQRNKRTRKQGNKRSRKHSRKYSRKY